MRFFMLRFIPFLLAFLLSALPAVAGSAISFEKFNDTFGARSSNSDKKKDELMKKLKGKTVEWSGKLKKKTIHFSKLALTLDMGELFRPQSVEVLLRSSEKKKLMEMNWGSIVVVRAKIEQYGHVRYHELVDGVILKYEQAKDGKPVDAKSLRDRKKNEQ